MDGKGDSMYIKKSELNKCKEELDIVLEKLEEVIKYHLQTVEECINGVYLGMSTEEYHELVTILDEAIHILKMVGITEGIPESIDGPNFFAQDWLDNHELREIILKDN
ncbi:anaerobic ribonucleoside-triphosphate reductase [Lachnospiraceae bacterium PF1-22]